MQEYLLVVRFKCEERSQAVSFQQGVQAAIDTVTCVKPEKPVSLVNDQIIRGAIARAWTYPKNTSKEMDRDFIEAAAREVTYL